MRIAYLITLILSIAGVFAQSLPVGTTLNDFFMPGSQPLESGTFNNPAGCGCHDQSNGYIHQGWQGSMMAHALPDPLFKATLSVANQDADSSGDLCLRCHTPTGWLEGRSVPTDGSILNSDDETSVNCFFCHRMVHPTPIGTNPYPTDSIYTADTYPVDQTYLSSISDHIPATSANGMYVADDISNYRRGPYSDANPNGHNPRYSPFHQRSDLCGTCHDVSNPVFSKNPDGSYSLNALDTPAPDFDPYTMFPVERTYSEWLNSSYNTAQGIYAPQFGGNKQYVSSCQDCHMRDVTGDGANNNVTRTDLGFHDLTGGNTFIPLWLEANGFMSTDVRDSSISRATRMLNNAASMTVTAVYKTITVRVTNETGHKLPSGYPEGRRMWLNVKAFDAGKTLFYESGAYEANTGILTQDSDIKVYEVKPGISQSLSGAVGLAAGPSFHFVLNDTIYKDNRIPPRGFSNANFDAVQASPVDYSYNDGEYWDETTYTLSQMPDSISVTLYYQTTSKEYVEFLRDTNSTDNNGIDMYNFWNTNGKSAPVVMIQKTLNSSDIPLPVSLSGLTISIIEDHPVISWRTHSEVNNLGFIIYRMDESNSAYIEIDSYEQNEDLVGLGNSSQGRVYTYVDMDASLQFGRTYFYQIADVSYDGKRSLHGPVSIVYKPSNAPITESFILRTNYPNPFNSGTTIRFYISEKQPVAVNIYDIQGRLIREFPKFLYFAGENEIFWDSQDNYGNIVPSGMYFYSVSTRNSKKQKKMLLIK